MVYIERCYLLLVLAMAVQAKRPMRPQRQFRDLYYSNIRNVTGTIAEHPLFNTVGKTTLDLAESTIHQLTIVPLAMARLIGVSTDIPNIINNNNFALPSGDILAEYEAGLGNSDATLRIDELILKYGYPLEIHETITDDGYVLKTFRIPNNGTAVLLMHGQLGSADDFVVAGPDSSLAYLLWKDGYDVWIGNARGNKHSRRHIEIDPSDARFWDFTWHEIGYYDMPALVDHILNTTKEKSLKFIGHSQGTTIFYVMAAEKPEYNEKISLMVSLAPSAFLSHAQSPMYRLLSPAAGVLHVLLKSVGMYEIMPDSVIMRTIKTLFCGTGPIAEVLCSNIFMMSCGFAFAELNVTNLPVIFGHVPSGASLKQVIHYSQVLISGDFKQFDYGSEQNKDKYGSEKPPSYVLEKITAPMSLFYSATDWMAHPEDVHRLHKRLKNVVDVYKIPLKQFNHLDFLWGKHFKTVIYKKLRKLFKAF